VKQFIKKLSLFLSLFTSVSTLFCCALPALFVALGAGALFAGVTAQFPMIFWLTKFKNEWFFASFLLLGASKYLSVKFRPSHCTADDPAACRETKAWGNVVWIGSVVIWVIGFSVAYVFPMFLTI
jgi:mercuric ion transport protein